MDKRPAFTNRSSIEAVIIRGEEESNVTSTYVDVEPSPNYRRHILALHSRDLAETQRRLVVLRMQIQQLNGTHTGKKQLYDQ